MAVSVVQLTGTKDDTASTNTAVASITNAPTTGNHLLLLAHIGSAADLSSVADSRSNTWQVDKTANGAVGFSEGIALASCHITNGFTNLDTITATFSTTSTRKNLYIIEVAGLDPSAWFGSATALAENVAATTRSTTNSLAAATAGDLTVGVWAIANTETGLTPTAPFSAWPTATGAGWFNGTTGAVEGVYLVTTDTSAQTPAATGARSIAYKGFAATYKQTATASQPIPLRVTLQAVRGAASW